MERVLVGKPEIAELCGVDRGTPAMWKRRELLPPSDHPPVNGHDTWYWSTIRSWAIRTGRLEDSADG